MNKRPNTTLQPPGPSAFGQVCIGASSVSKHCYPVLVGWLESPFTWLLTHINYSIAACWYKHEMKWPPNHLPTTSSKWGFPGHMTSTSHDTKILTLSISATAATLVVPSGAQSLSLSLLTVYTYTWYHWKGAFHGYTSLSLATLPAWAVEDIWPSWCSLSPSVSLVARGAQYISPPVLHRFPWYWVHLVVNMHSYRCLSLATTPAQSIGEIQTN